MITIVSYVVKSNSTRKRFCVLMTSKNTIKGITIDDKKRKPVLFKEYDFTKGSKWINLTYLPDFTIFNVNSPSLRPSLYIHYTYYM